MGHGVGVGVWVAPVTIRGEWRGRLRKDRRAAGGFFEELPAFSIVVISVSVFLVMSVNSYGAYTRSQELSPLHDDARALLSAFRAYEQVLERGAVTLEPLTGHLDAAKLSALNSTALRRDLSARHPFNLTVTDHRSTITWAWGEKVPGPSGSTSTARVGTAAVVVALDGGRNPGTILVVMWQ